MAEIEELEDSVSWGSVGG